MIIEDTFSRAYSLVATDGHKGAIFAMFPKEAHTQRRLLLAWTEDSEKDRKLYEALLLDDHKGLETNASNLVAEASEANLSVEKLDGVARSIDSEFG